MNLLETLPPALDEKVRRELQPREHIVWLGRPMPRFFTLKSTPAFLMGLLWTGMSLFMASSAVVNKLPTLRLDGPPLIPLLGLLLVLPGLGMICAPLWAYLRGTRTVYVITDRRAITFDAGWRTAIRSYYPEELQSMVPDENGDGTGSVVFGERLVPESDGSRTQLEVGFLNIRGMARVTHLLRSLAESPVETWAEPPPPPVPEVRHVDFESYVGTIVGSLFVLAMAIAFCAHAFDAIRLGRQSLTWPSVAGVVEVSKLKVSDDSDDGTKYRPDIRYSFVYQGYAHTGDRVRCAMLWQEDARTFDAVMAKYPVQQAVSVYVNPHNPSEAVLEPGVSEDAWRWLEITAVGVSIVIVIWTLCALAACGVFTRPPARAKVVKPEPHRPPGPVKRFGTRRFPRPAAPPQAE